MVSMWSTQQISNKLTCFTAARYKPFTALLGEEGLVNRKAFHDFNKTLCLLVLAPLFYDKVDLLDITLFLACFFQQLLFLYSYECEVLSATGDRTVADRTVADQTHAAFGHLRLVDTCGQVTCD